MGRITKAEKQRREEEKNKPYTLFLDSRVTKWIDGGYGQPRPAGFEIIKIQLVNQNANS